MSSSSNSKPSRLKVQAHRERLRQQGLRPIQVWVPDVRAPSFRSEAHRQSLAVATSSLEREDQALADQKTDGQLDHRLVVQRREDRLVHGGGVRPVQTLQTTCQDNGFLSLKFANGVWPFPESSTPPGQQN